MIDVNDERSRMQVFYNATQNRLAIEREQARRTWSKQAEREQLIDSAAAGLQTSISASPGLYSSFVFDVRAMAAVSVDWLLSQPRR